MSGKFAKTGIPAAIVTKYLAEHGVVVEKTGLYSFFIMFTIGITKGRWNTLLTALQQFKDDYDRNAPMWPRAARVLRRASRATSAWACATCRRASTRSTPRATSRGSTTDMYLSDLQPAMKPSDAFAYIAHRKTERVDIDQLEGRITTSLLTPYPPGIPLLIPGERFNRKIVDYLRFTRDFNAAVPRLRHRRARPDVDDRDCRASAIEDGDATTSTACAPQLSVSLSARSAPVPSRG